jgi:ketosteroid isomerase-like protein
VSRENIVNARTPLAVRLALRFPDMVALITRLVLLVPARWWPGRNSMFVRGFPVGLDFVRIPRDDAVWAALSRASAPGYAPDFVYEDDFLPDHAGETYHGWDGLRRAWTGYTEPYEEMVYALDRVVGSGDRLVSIHRVWTKARHTGIVQDFGGAYIWTFRRGRVVHFRGFHDPDEALKAAGLEG